MSQARPVSLKNLVSTVKRGQAARPTTYRQPATTPNQQKPLKSPQPKCGKTREPLKPVPSVSMKITFEQRRQLIAKARRREAELPAFEIEEEYFTILSTEEIDRIAVTEVNNTEQFGPGSVNDPQMGPTEATTLCATCSKDNVECPGHPGYIQLAEPFLHPLFIRETVMVLNVVCNDCGGLLMSRDQIRESGLFHLTGYNRLKALEKSSVGLVCQRQKGPQDLPCVKNPVYLPKKSKETHQIFYEYDIKGEKVENYRTPEEILNIFKNITEEEAELMGFTNGAHPKKLIMEKLLVIPPIDRPPIVEEGRYMPDGLTTMYIDIVRQNNNLRDYKNQQAGTAEKPIRRKGERKRTKEPTIQSLRDAVFNRIKYLIDNKDEIYKIGGQAPITIKQIIQGKEGLIRSYIMGKRVDYSARTVLTPDPTLSFGQISVPLAFAPILGPKVRVNRYNRDELQNLLEKGRVSYITFSENPSNETTPDFRSPGSRQAVTEKIQKNYRLQDGDMVERWLQNGDMIIFNRQPTLHLYSFMGYRVVLRDQKTFGLNLSYTTPHNADFDGDEGNLFILQSLEARAEAEELMNVRNCLINVQSNKPTMGIVFDGIVGAYLMTQPDTFVEALDYYDALSFLTEREQLASLERRLEKYNVPYVVTDENERKFTGRALFSALLPEDFFYEGPKGVIIKEGVLVNGVITKAHIGPEKNSIIHQLSANYPVVRVANFITDATYVINRWLQSYGFSIGLSSCYIDDPQIQEAIMEQIEKARRLVEAMGMKPDDPIEAEKYERQIMAYLETPLSKVGKQLEEKLPKSNALNIATLSGAKGKISNLIQIAALVGQQQISGQRIKQQISSESRCLPYFNFGENSLEARGFCTRSFIKGLGVAEAYFQQMSGREGITQMAVSTSETGFLQRKAVKSLEDIKTAYDGSVRNVDRTIFEYVYGDDGFNPTFLKEVKTEQGNFLSFFDADIISQQINLRYGF